MKGGILHSHAPKQTTSCTSQRQPSELPNHMQIQSSKDNCGGHSSLATPAPIPHPLPPIILAIGTKKSELAFLVSLEAGGSHMTQLGLTEHHWNLLGVSEKVLAFQVKETFTLPLLFLSVLNGNVMSGAVAVILQP